MGYAALRIAIYHDFLRAISNTQYFPFFELANIRKNLLQYDSNLDKYRLALLF